jgi:dienelactone hydrolase
MLPNLAGCPARFPSYSYLILSGAGAMMYEDEADTLRGYQRALFKGSPEEQPEAHAKSSPITYVEDVAAPLLVIQGSNDTRCPPRPMEAYEAKMKAAGKSIEVQWFEAGHGSGDVALTIAQQESMMTFALGVLEEVVAPVAATASARL